MYTAAIVHGSTIEKLYAFPKISTTKLFLKTYTSKIEQKFTKRFGEFKLVVMPGDNQSYPASFKPLPKKPVRYIGVSSISWEKHECYAALNRCMVCGLPLSNPISVAYSIGPECGGFANTKEYRKACKSKDGVRNLDDININWKVVKEKLSMVYSPMDFSKNFRVMRETTKAIQLQILHKSYWFPKSVIIYVNQLECFFVKKFVLKDKPELEFHCKMVNG